MSETELVVNGHNAPVAIAPTMSREQIDLIKRTVAKGTTDDELALFLHVCKRTGLDPLARQIHAVKRWNSREQREVMTIQTGIDGYRLTAARTGEHMGTDDAVFDSEEGEHPRKASVTAYRLRNGQPVPFTASARWEEYLQTNKDGDPNPMWVKMPYLMLGKCAEALALRKAFPAELSSVYTHEEMMQADSEPQRSPRPAPPPSQPTPQPSAPTSNNRLITKGQLEILLLSARRSRMSEEDLQAYVHDTYNVARLQALQQKDLNAVLEWVEAQYVATVQEEKPELEDPPITPSQQKGIFANLREHGVSTDDFKLYVTNVLKHEHTREITQSEHKELLEKLKNGKFAAWLLEQQQEEQEPGAEG